MNAIKMYSELKMLMLIVGVACFPILAIILKSKQPTDKKIQATVEAITLLIFIFMFYPCL